MTAGPAIIPTLMSFARRYLTSLVAPPAIVTLPLALLFITQVVQLSLGTTFVVVALLLVLGAGAAVALFAGVSKEPNGAAEVTVVIEIWIVCGEFAAPGAVTVTTPLCPGVTVT